MAEGKRYYWLRLHDDFFRSVRIKKLRKMAGGDTYLIIYLKLQLLAIKSDGVLTWKGYEQDFVDELSLDLDEEPDDVRVTLMYLLSCGLAETEDNVNFFFPYAVENTGSEGASAERMRKHRERQASLCDTPVTEPLRLCDGEKEIETIDIERDKIQEIDSTNPDGFVCRTKDVRRITDAWNSLGLQQITKITGESKRGGMLRARVHEYGVDAVLGAIEKIRHSEYLKGQNRRGWVITFEWLVKPNNFVKVLEGNYDTISVPGNRTASELQESYRMMGEWANDTE